MRYLALFLTTASLLIPGLQAKNKQPLEEAVRHSLATLPYYSVFDELGFQVNGSTVTLNGEVTLPVVKDDAANAVKHVEGVTSVINHIEVLPLSPTDDHIRLAVYRAVYSSPTLSARYGIQARPPIHIIVKNGVVKLEGVVANKMDRQVAGMSAQGVGGVFRVENDLQVAS